MDNVEKIDLAKIGWKSSREFFESLTSELEKLEDRDESYNFTWVRKRKSIIKTGRPVSKILRPDIDASKDFDNTKNMLIVGDNTVYPYGYLGENSGLAVGFDGAISDSTIQEIAKLKPIAAVFKDFSFADSATKINLSEHFRILSVDAKVKVI